MEFSKEVALVTGAASGIGRATALELARRGAAVVVNVLGHTPNSEQVVRDIRTAGGTAVAVAADISTSAGVEALFEQAESALGFPSILVCNAGVLRPLDVVETTDEDWRWVLATNLDGTFYCARRAIPAMRRAARGRLIFVGSIAGQQGSMAGHAAYSASKAAVAGLSRTLAITEAPYGITSNVVAPGVIDTPLLRANHAGASIDRIGEGIPLGLGTPADVAGVIAFLAGPAARYTTGATIDVNGGLYRR